MENLVKIVKEYESYVNSEDYHEDNDYKDYIYEAAVEAVLGKEFWKILNNKSYEYKTRKRSRV